MQARGVGRGRWGTLFVLVLLYSAASPAWPEELDARTVQARVQALGVRDDSLPDDERPSTWLRKRRDRVTPQLMAGLGDPNHRVAEACLWILTDNQVSGEILEALLPIAGDPKHSASASATLALAQYPTDERAVRLMAAAFADEQRFPDPFNRAKLAAASRKNYDAIAILSALVEKGDDDYRPTEAVRRLPLLGPEAIPALEKASQSRKWGAAREAYLALDQLDPKNHALTADQREFLSKGGRSFKAEEKFYRQRQKELAALDRRQTRPFVMQALASSDYQAIRDALSILTIWQDQPALPEIKRLIEENPRASSSSATAAYLAIEGGQESDQFVLGKLAGRSGLSAEDGLRAIVRAEIPNQRRLELLRKARGVIRDAPYALPHSLNFFQGDLALLLGPLMDEETDIRALGMYAEKAGQDQQKRFAKQIARAVGLLATAAQGTPGESHEFGAAARRILGAAAAYELKEVEADLTALAGSASPEVRLAAAAAGARISGQLDENVKALLDQLGSADLHIRRQARDGLGALKPADEAQRRQVEARLLSHLGKPSEDCALRVLAKFGGEDAVRSLEPVLDDTSVPRAIYAAWVLAQIAGQPPTREAALRRLAIFGMFHYYCGQRDVGIAFTVANGVYFHQTTGRLNPGVYRDEDQAVRLPPELLKPFELRPAEQQFAVRAYRHDLQERSGHSLGDIARGAFGIMDASYVPLLQVITREDPILEPLYCKDQKAAHFPRRRLAAQQLARLTGQPATYMDLGGEALDSAQVPPAPYRDQNLLIARFVLDRIQPGLPDKAPQFDAEWQQINWRNDLLRNLVRNFGGQLQEVLVAEIARRGLTESFRKMRLAEHWPDSR